MALTSELQRTRVHDTDALHVRLQQRLVMQREGQHRVVIQDVAIAKQSVMCRAERQGGSSAVSLEHDPRGRANHLRNAASTSENEAVLDGSRRTSTARHGTCM